MAPRPERFRFKVKDFIEAEPKKSADAAAPVYETAEQIKSMPPCQATVEPTAPCSSLFTTIDGKKFYIDSPGATREVGNFLGPLQEAGLRIS
jgi:hypothetical protein